VGTDHSDGEPPLVDAGAGDCEGQAGGQSGANLLDDQRPLTRPAFERSKLVSSS
jgi:hypothetical protein